MRQDPAGTQSFRCDASDVDMSASDFDAELSSQRMGSVAA
jgi:hypothetical protein